MRSNSASNRSIRPSIKDTAFGLNLGLDIHSFLKSTSFHNRSINSMVSSGWSRSKNTIPFPVRISGSGLALNPQ